MTFLFESLAAVMAFAYGSFFEWVLPRYFMHREWRPFELLYLLHTGDHHVTFQVADFEWGASGA